MAIAVGGMHPTGMHSCLIIFLTNEYTSTQYVMYLIPERDHWRS